MRQIAVYENLPTDHPECFVEINAPMPEAQGHDIFVKVKAISVNPTDMKDRHGLTTRLADPLVLGWDLCGEVVSTGERVTKFSPGDMIIAAGDVERSGCYADYMLVDQRLAGFKPSSLTDVEAATLSLTSLAAWEALFERLKIQTADVTACPSLLIIGGAGGLGSMAIQFARQFSGCRVIATASRPETKEWCVKMGAHDVIDHAGDIEAQLADLGEPSVTYILICANNLPYWTLMSRIIAPEGAVCLVSSTKEKLDLDLFMGKSVQINYELMFTPSLYNTAKMWHQGAFLSSLSKMLDTSRITHVMTENFGPMSPQTLAKAHARLESGKTVGKIALSAMEPE
jgi:alcohol dehydrogenase